MTEPQPIRLPIPSWLALSSYALLANLALPVGLLLAAPFLLLQEKRRRTLLPRLGFEAFPDFRKSRLEPVWVHALSVGELLSAAPLIRALKPRLAPRPLVVSVSTLAANGLAEARLKDCTDGLFYFPYDTAMAYRRCLKRVRPALFLLIETDIWPGYLRCLRRQGVPCWLLNARLSPRSFRARRCWWSLFGPALECFERIHGQSPVENRLFTALGVDPARLGRPGNLKFDACGPAPSAEAIAALSHELGYAPGTRLLLAGSTHPGEEEMVRRVFLQLRTEWPDLKLIAVPRHPHRGEEVRGLFAGDPVRVALWTERTQPAPDVLVVNELGHLGRLYGLCELAIVGGSFVPKGGQNPIEPAMVGKPVLFGPDMSDFPDVAPELVSAGAAFSVRDESDLLECCRRFLREPVLARATGAKGRAVMQSHAGITNQLVEAVLARV